MNTAFLVEKTTHSFLDMVHDAPFIHAIHSAEDYASALAFTESLMEEIGDHTEHPIWPLLELVMASITRYENKMHPELEVMKKDSTVAVLRTLMDQHNLKQKDLVEIGSQGVVSEVLNHKRSLNVQQIKALAERFNISPALFL